MMKQTRMIRISFLICAIGMTMAFWGGFYYGNGQFQAEQMPVQTASGTDGDSGEKTTAKKEDSENKETVESMKQLTAETYYVKVSGEYLSVYFSDTDRLYFETGLKLSDLPEYLRKEALTGISFATLENVYSFLENYSS